MLRRGEAVDRYEVDAEIGRGGMAVVYRVHHRTLGSAHALKVLYLPSPALNERVMQEGRIQASLRHPNVVAVTDVVDVNGAPGLIMDYIEGEDLERWLSLAPRADDELLRIFREVVAGVAYAHSRGLVHRDLKPANVLMSQVNGRWTPLITDFGLAKALSGSGLPGATRSNVTMGTPSYMAPEQIRNAKAVDQRADVFSLGALLYRMMVGHPPFRGDDVLAVMQATADGDYEPPERAAPRLAPPVARVMHGCLAADPARRIQRCAQLLEVLDGAEPDGVALTGGGRGRGPRPVEPAENQTFIPMDTQLASQAPPPTLPASAISAPRPRWPRWAVGLVLLVGVVAAWPGSEPAPAPIPPAEATPSEVPPAEVAEAEAQPLASPPSTVAPPDAAGELPGAAAPRELASKTRRAAVAAPASAPAVPEEPGAGAASVSVAGDALEVWLEGEAGRFALGQGTSVPAGSWRIRARFDDSGPVAAGRASLTAGVSTTITCSAAFQRCQAKVQP